MFFWGEIFQIPGIFSSPIHMYIYNICIKVMNQLWISIDSTVEQSRNDEWINLIFNYKYNTMFDIKTKEDAIIIGITSSYLWDCDLWCLVVAQRIFSHLHNHQIILHSLKSPNFIPIYWFLLITVISNLHNFTHTSFFIGKSIGYNSD